MTRLKRIVIDTDILLLAMLSGTCEAAVAARRAMELAQIVCSEELLGDLSARLNSRSFDRYVSLDHRRELMTGLRRIVLVPGRRRPIKEELRERHRLLLSAAISGEADSVMTRDPTLLAISPFRHIVIAHPDAYLKTGNRLMM